MDHPRHFEKFQENISLDESRAGRLNAALRGLSGFLASDKLRELLTGEMYFQGSYAYHTVTRPLAETTEYDVDVVVPLDARRRPEGRQHPDAILEYVQSRLNTSQAYAGKVTRRRVCVRVNYAGDFHLDLVPGHQPGGPGTDIWIPNRETGKWERSLLQEYAAWVQSVNAGRAQFRLTRTIKILKRWRDSTFGIGRGPSSIILTTLAGYYNPGAIQPMPIPSAFAAAPSDASFLYDTVHLLDHYLQPFSGTIILYNPVDRTENLARNWTADDFSLFKKRLTTLKNRVAKAYLEDDRERSINYWREAFPDGFPARP